MRRRAEMERESASLSKCAVMVWTHGRNERAAYGLKNDDKACGRRL